MVFVFNLPKAFRASCCSQKFGKLFLREFAGHPDTLDLLPVAFTAESCIIIQKLFRIYRQYIPKADGIAIVNRIESLFKIIDIMAGLS